jgi:hypothetical protein
VAKFKCPNCSQTLQQYYREQAPKGLFWRVVDSRADEAWRILNDTRSSNKAIQAARDYLENAR